MADLTDIKVLAALPHLNAVINEAMRLHPAALTGGVRKTPDNEGVNIAGVYIPPETTIVAPRYTISRRECVLSSSYGLGLFGLRCPANLFLRQGRTVSSVVQNLSLSDGPRGPT